MKLQDIRSMALALQEMKKKDADDVVVVDGKKKRKNEKETEVEVQELSKKTLGSYVKKATDDYGNQAIKLGRGNERGNHLFNALKRRKGVQNAVDKLTKESAELDELSKKTLANYTTAASFDKSGHAHEIGKVNQIAATSGTNKKDRARRDYHDKKHGNRSLGISRAVNKLSKESVEEMAAPRIRDSILAKYADKLKKNPAQTPIEVDGVKAIIQNKKIEKQSAANAGKSLAKESTELDELSKKTLVSYISKAQKDIASKPLTRKTSKRLQSRNKAIHKYMSNESYEDHKHEYKDKLLDVSSKIHAKVKTIAADMDKAKKSAERVKQAYADGKKPSKADLALSSKYMDAHHLKTVHRSLEDVADNMTISEAIQIDDRKPISINHALQMMRENDRSKRYKGATDPETIDSKMSDASKNFMKVHKMDTPDEVDINKVLDKNKTEIEKSLTRRVNYRSNDQQIGDKKLVGNDGK